MQIRLQKLFNAGLARDAAAQAELAPSGGSTSSASNPTRAGGLNDPALEQFRWMLEELRVSLFAQELEDVGPGFPQALETLWELVQP